MRLDVSAVTRRSVIIGTSLLVAGCVGPDSSVDQTPTDEESGDSGAPSSDSDNPATGETDQVGDLMLSSPAFEDGEQIPEKYGYEAENVNPPLEFENVPDEVETLALVMDDPDAVEPAGTVWDHWVVWNIPAGTTTIPENWNPSTAKEGTNDYGTVGYGGPNPPDEAHRYRFKLFALDATLDLPSETDVVTLGSAMEGRILEQTQLDGTYPA